MTFEFIDISLLDRKILDMMQLLNVECFVQYKSPNVQSHAVSKQFNMYSNIILIYRSHTFLLSVLISSFKLGV